MSLVLWSFKVGTRQSVFDLAEKHPAPSHSDFKLFS